MTGLNIKDFLTYGAFLQIGPDLFKVMIGPFSRHDSVKAALLEHSALLYKPNFWDFMNKNGNLSQKPVYSAAKTHLFDRAELIEFLTSMQSKRPLVEWKPVNEAQFKTQFEWSQSNFNDQKLSKSVPIMRQQGLVKFTVENLLWCIQNLIQNKTFGWSYGFFENEEGVIGHTPEILAQWTRIDRQLHTVALAGTYAKGENAHDKIMADKKILNEHQIVIDDIIDKLNSLNFKARSIQGPTDVLELKYLLHLMTEFQIEINNVEQVFEVIDVLHPTSAMGLYPNDRTKLKEFSEFTIQKERDLFAAPFAIVENDCVYCVVGIRNLLFKNDQVQIFSGCGVTKESDYELELTELQNKRDSVKKMMGIFND